MADNTRDRDDAQPRQEQRSTQSEQQGEPKKQSGEPDSGQQTPPGIGASQGQDRESPADRPEGRPSAGTPDIERGAGQQDVERPASRDSLVQDPTGAYKERP